MTSPFRLLAVSAGIFFAAASFAQAPAAPAVVAPAVKAAPAMVAPAPVAAPAAAAPAPAITPAVSASAKPAAKTTPAAAPSMAAAGGGAGKVWMNTKSKIYHCEGTKFYGKTKVGEYMAEADAKAAGGHGVGGKACAAK